ncbi:MAG: hypothetical protein ABI723_17505 [Bacteroidia bacterium]
MKSTFQIRYKLSLGEAQDAGYEYITALNVNDALKKFALMNKINPKKFASVEDWTWEDGLWYGFFKSIKKVKEISCPHCNGTGIIHA